jgi:transposase-like protein
MSKPEESETSIEKTPDVRLVAASEDEDFIRCMTYIQMREIGHAMTKVQIAEEFGVSRTTLDKWIMKWENSGLLRKCRQAYMIPRAEEIRVAEDLLLDDWPEILDHARYLAKGGGKSEKVAADMIMWIHEAIVQPKLQEREEAGSEEFAYIEAQSVTVRQFDPLSLPDGDESEEDE